MIWLNFGGYVLIFNLNGIVIFVVVLILWKWYISECGNVIVLFGILYVLVIKVVVFWFVLILNEDLLFIVKIVIFDVVMNVSGFVFNGLVVLIVINLMCDGLMLMEFVVIGWLLNSICIFKFGLWDVIFGLVIGVILLFLL